MNVLLYGLSWSLPFPAPELLPTKGAAEVEVIHGKINEKGLTWKLQGVCFKAAPGAYFLEIPGVVRFMVTGGNRIIFDAPAHVPPQEIMHFLFHPVAGALLMQRGILPLQASAVARDGKAAILMGASVCGKSLLAAGLVRHGYKVLTDAVCAVHPGKQPIIKAGLPHLLLWNKALKALDHGPESLSKFRPNIDKHTLRVTDDARALDAVAGSIYLLTTDNESGYKETPIFGQQKFVQLMEHTYHDPLIDALGVKMEMYRIMIALAEHCPLTRVARPFQLENARDFIDNFARRCSA